MNKVVRITMATLALFTLTSCLSYEEKKEERDHNKFVYIGAVHSFTGVFATQGVEVEQATDLAVAHINAGGGIIGKKIALIKRDTGAQEEVCSQQAIDLIQNEGVRHIFGAIESGCTNSILDVTVPAGVLTVTGNPYASVLSTGRQNQGLFYRTSPNNARLMQSLASKILLDGNSSLTIIAGDNMLNATSADDMVRYYSALDCGGARCKVNLRYDYPADMNPEAFDYGSAMTEILAANSDAIFFSGYPDDGVGFLRAAIDAGYTGKPYISAEMGHASIGSFLDAKTASAVEWVDITPSSGASFDYFKKEYEATYGEPVSENRLSERSYDMLMLFALAVQKTGTDLVPNIVAQSIFDVANPPGELIFADEYSRALELIAQGVDIDYNGASGSCDFDVFGDVPVNEIFMGYDASGEPSKKY